MARESGRRLQVRDIALDNPHDRDTLDGRYIRLARGTLRRLDPEKCSRRSG